MKSFFTRRDLSAELRTRMARCYVFSVLLYGCESWTLDSQTEKRIEAFEMYVYRRMLRISWVQRITNDEVLQRMQKQKEILNTIKERKTQYLGHVMRGDRYCGNTSPHNRGQSARGKISRKTPELMAKRFKVIV